jgi:putative addiction module component (TIGR02574 family)
VVMARSLQQIQEEIRELSTSDKETLLRALWEDLDGPADPGVDAAWLDEAKRRDAELDAGSVESVPASDVFERLRASLKK